MNIVKQILSLIILGFLVACGILLGVATGITLGMLACPTAFARGGGCGAVSSGQTVGLVVGAFLGILVWDKLRRRL